MVATIFVRRIPADSIEPSTRLARRTRQRGRGAEVARRSLYGAASSGKCSAQCSRSRARNQLRSS